MDVGLGPSRCPWSAGVTNVTLSSLGGFEVGRSVSGCLCEPGPAGRARDDAEFVQLFLGFL